ncbi:S1 family peptidase [candidate division KSB1 bacterium]|nr:S1 family peptidase [candidate division KSB1 bacterium]
MTTKTQLLEVKKVSQTELMKKQNVKGVGIGYKVKNGVRTDQLCLVVMVQKKVKNQALSSADLVPAEIQGLPTDVIEVGEIVAHKARTDRWRPAPPGVSIGHYAITAGTFGAVVRDVATGQKLILSNNHVLANSNDASLGDNILQPGAADGGKNPQDLIGTLERFVKIQMEGDSGGDDNPTCPIAKAVAWFLNLLAKLFGSRHRLEARRVVTIEASEPNRVDAAVAKPLSQDAITNEIIDIGKVNGIREAELGLAVMKSGRTSLTTEGSITAINSLVQVSYGGTKIANFEDQIITSYMSKPGDSGSLLVSKDKHEAVGLLFAGSDTVTIHSPIIFVMEYLNIDFNL